MKESSVSIICNPTSGRSGDREARVRLVAGLLEHRGIRTTLMVTKGPGDATRLARQALESGAGTIVAYGGDGTINEVLQAVVKTDVALAIWPGGTANVAALELGMPSNPGRMAEIVATRKTRRISVGLAVAGSASGGRGEQGETGRYFFMFAGIGLDASVANRVNTRLKRFAGELAFWVEGLRHIATWRPDRFHVEVDGKTYESVFALVGNGKGYGGRLCLTPDADLAEPSFEVFILPPRSNNLKYLPDLVRLVRGEAVRDDVIIVKGTRVRANSSNRPLVETDGEVIGPLPMSFEVIPNSLTIIVP